MELAHEEGGGRPGCRPLPAALDIPALAVAGPAGPWPTAEVSAGITASLQRPELLVTDRAEHLPSPEAGARFNQALLAFLLARSPGPVPS